jgi:hypothetical protein
VLDFLKQRLFAMRRENCTFAALGYDDCETEPLQRHLEGILHVAIDAFQLAMRQPDLDLVVAELEHTVDDHHRGFAFEGVGAYLAAIDLATMGATRRLERLLRGPGGHHDGLAILGAGFAVARVPWGAWLWQRYRSRLDPQLAWCMADGLGFHQGLFHHRRYVHRCQPPPAYLPAHDLEPFDSGIGRSLWWVEGASPDRIADRIRRFPADRRAELWNGIGTACTYAGGVDESVLRALSRLSAEWGPDFLSGVCFAPLIRRRGRNPSARTEAACRELLRLTADEASDLSQSVIAEVEEGLSGDGRRARELYTLLRRRVRQLPQIAGRSRRAEAVSVALTSGPALT